MCLCYKMMQLLIIVDQNVLWKMWIWSVSGQTQTLSGPLRSPDKHALHKRRSLCCQRRGRWQKVWLRNPNENFNYKWMNITYWRKHPSLCMSPLASLCGGVSMPLTEAHTWTRLAQKVQVSPSMALQRKDAYQEKKEEKDRPGSL